jgi:hypothetical protein
LERGTRRKTISHPPARWAFLVLVALVHSPNSGFATPLPETARSGSTLTPSVLQEDPVNLYVFPQLVPSGSSTLLAFGASGESAPGAGTSMSLGRYTFHYLFLNGFPSRIYGGSASSESEDRPLSQVGWGVQFGGIRLGLSYGWAVTYSKETNLNRSFYSDGAQKGVVREAAFDTADYRSATFGVGWQEGRTSCELAIGLHWEDVKFDWSRLYETAHQIELRKQTVETDVRASTGYHPAVALRLALPFGEAMLLRAYGSFRDEGFDISRDLRFGEWVNDFLVEQDWEEYRDEQNGQEWSSGISLKGRARWSTQWLAHAFWEDVRSPIFYLPRRGTFSWWWEQEQGKTKRGQCGVALRVPFFWRMEVLSGAAVRAEWVTETLEEYREGRLSEAHTDQETSTSYAFAWGLARDFEFLELTASVRKTLDPTDPFALLDIGIRF